MREQYDAIVIGSGFGGAVTAARLAQAGRSVCILERGRRWDKREFPRSIGQVKNAMWRDNESYGFIEYKVFRRMDVIQGVGVGGGSLHYFNVHLRADKFPLDAVMLHGRATMDYMEEEHPELADELRFKLAGQPVSAAPVTDAPAPPPSRTMNIFASVSGLALLAVGLGLIALIMWGSLC